MQQLQKANTRKLQRGDKVVLTPYPEDFNNTQLRDEDIAEFQEWRGESALIKYAKGAFVSVNKHDLYVPVLVPQQSPVLIELEKAVEYLRREFLLSPKCLQEHFSKPENQYKQLQPIFEVGDTVALPDGREFPITYIYEAGKHKDFGTAIYVVDRVRWDASLLKLIKKAEPVVFEVGDTVKVTNSEIYIVSVGRCASITAIIPENKHPVRCKFLDTGLHHDFDYSDLTLVKKAEKTSLDNEPEWMKNPVISATPKEVVDRTNIFSAETPTKEEWMKDAVDNAKKYSEEDVALEMMDTAREVFTIEDARKLYKESDHGKYVAMLFYTEDELKEKQLPTKFEDLINISGFQVDEWSGITEVVPGDSDEIYRNVYPTIEHAKAALAMAQLLQLRKAWIDQEAPGWEPDWTDNTFKTVIKRVENSISCHNSKTGYYELSFPSYDLCEKFLIAFPNLLRIAFCLTVDNTKPATDGNKIP